MNNTTMKLNIVTAVSKWSLWKRAVQMLMWSFIQSKETVRDFTTKLIRRET